MSVVSPRDPLKFLGLPGKLALLVDENEHTLRLVIQFLRSFGMTRILTATSPSEALQTLQHAKIDFVICNWSTPPLDGAAFVQRVRASENQATRQVPVIILKEQVRPAEVIAARDAGATEFLAIPLSSHALLAALESALIRQRQFIEAETFRGPDRRRRRDPETSVGRRESDRQSPEQDKAPARE